MNLYQQMFSLPYFDEIATRYRPPDVFKYLPLGANPSSIQVDANSKIVVPVMTGVMKGMPLTNNDTASSKMAGSTFEEQRLSPCVSKGHYTLTLDQLQGLVKPGPNGGVVLQRRGLDFVDFQASNLVKRFNITYNNSIVSMLTQFKVQANESGDIVTTGGVRIADAGVPAGNLNQLNVFNTGNIIDVSWANASADLATQISMIKEAAIKSTGLPLKYALYGSNVRGNITKNTVAQAYLPRNLQANNVYTDLPDSFDLMGLTWIGAHNIAWIKENDTINSGYVDLLGPDDVVFLPEVGPEWWRLYHVTSYGWRDGMTTGQMTGPAVTAAIEEHRFAYGYTEALRDPDRAKLWYGGRWLPWICNGNAVFKADTVFG